MRRTVILILGGIFLLLPWTGFSAFDLSVTPYEGTSSLNFGRITPGSSVNKEVKLRILSTQEVQYQLRQQLLDPLVNEKGQQLERTALQFYTLRGSNSQGSLHQDSPFPLSLSEQTIYTSNPQGDSDSFIVVYTVEPQKLNVSGKFSGRILYTLRPISANISPKTVILNVYLEVETGIKVSLETSSGGNFLRLSSGSPQRSRGYVKLELSGAGISPLQVYQRLEDFARNEKQEPLPEEVLKFSVSSTQKGKVYYPADSLLERKSILLGESEGRKNTFVINFSLEPQGKSLKAGLYKTRIYYDIYSEDFQKTFPVDLEIEIKPIFDIEISSSSSNLISFSNLKPNLPPQQREVVVRVKNNLERPYEVVQNVSSLLTNEEGVVIEEKYFQMRIEKPKEEKGEVKIRDFTPVKPGAMRIFSSDDKGSPSEFKIIYRLEVPFNLRAGNYRTNISYSILEK